MSEETNIESNDVAPTDKSVDISDFGPSQSEKFREQAERVHARKERTSSIIDDVWDNASGDAKTLKEANTSMQDKLESEERNDEQQASKRSDSRESDEGTEESERTFKDVTDEVWDSATGEPEAEENAEGDSEESEESNELPEGEESEEGLQESGEDRSESQRDDVITATIEGEDGPEQIEIPKDAKITVKVDGVEQEVSLQEFANGISGQKAISQKFSALNGEQKAFESRLQHWNESSAKAAELMNDNNAVEAIQHVAEMMGHDPQLLFTSLFEQITPVLNQYADLSQEGRAEWVQNIKNQKAEFQAKSAQDELNKLRAEQEQQGKVQNVQKTYGLDEATFTHAYHALEAEMEAGTLTKQPITPELVGQYTQLVQREHFATEALKGTSHEGDSHAISQVLQAVHQMEQRGVEISEQSIKDMVADALGREQQIEKSKTVNKSLKKKGVKPKAKGNKKPKQVQRKNPSDSQKSWMDRALDELDGGASAEDLGLTTRKKRK